MSDRLRGTSCIASGRPIRSAAMCRICIRRASVARWLGVGLAVWAVTAAAGLTAPSDVAIGQEYREIRDVEPLPRDVERELVNAMRGGSIPDRGVFDQYMRYKVAQFTWPENRADLYKMRDAIVKRDLFQAEGAAYSAMNSFLLEQMEALASNEEFHPATRLNAVLLLGLLDRQKPNFSGRDYVPLPEALPVLTSVLERAGGGKVDDLLAIASLVGLRRQAGAERKAIGTDEQQQLARTAVAVLSAQRPDNRSMRVDGWLRRSLAELLQRLGSAGVEPSGTEVVDALRDMAANEDYSVTVRCAAAETVGYLNLSDSGDSLQLDPWLVPLAKLARGVMEQHTSVAPVVFYLESVQTALLGPDTGSQRDGGLVSVAEGQIREALSSLSEHVGRVVDNLVDYGVEEPDLPPDYPQLRQDLEQAVSAIIGAESPAPENEELVVGQESGGERQMR